MADKKISALTAAATPLAGTEVLPIVQSGSTVKVSVDNLTYGKTVTVQSLKLEKVGTFAGSGFLNANQFVSLAVNNGSVDQFYINQSASQGALEITSDSNLKVLSGKGIDFSANTHAAGMTSELLNDYEEGTWTPTRNAFVEVVGAGSITTTGVYTKIGRVVHAQAIILATGGATIAATSGAGSYLGGLPFTPASITSGTWVNGSSIATSGGTAIYTDGNVYIATSWVAAGGQWNFSITYTV